MPRRRKELTTALRSTPALPAGRLIEPTAVYRLAELTALLGLKASSLSREVRERRLRVHKRCGIYFFTGADVLDWIRGGDVKRGNATNGQAAGPGAPGPAPVGDVVVVPENDAET